ATAAGWTKGGRAWRWPREDRGGFPHLTSVSPHLPPIPALCGVSTQQLTSVTCFHCGDPCADEHRVHDGKDFCCHGCEVVYELLNEAGLCDYYGLDQQPGVKQRTTVDEQRMELFELDEVRAKL